MRREFYNTMGGDCNINADAINAISQHQLAAWAQQNVQHAT